ncbi:phage tail sheath family protein [Chryseobacterium sp. R2A-55]|uniref:phage tail sheath family protein n=1 Tax=Chryseobacterium sp. R2A-55 TaxID=2744445 RepID=UPI001F2F39CD|nr:phage tail sheath C-terminal domain-containing protein [Chryseobacterium sp. R2A-55]
MAKWNFPGVYIDEVKNNLIPTVRSLENTAVLLGYTEKSQNIQNIPTEIHSLLEFENFFGKAQAEKNLVIHDYSASGMDGLKVSFCGKKSNHNLYYSVKLFFENGGNSCKIVSVGLFKEIGEPLSANDFKIGLDALENENGNLLIAVPESQNLSETDFYLLQRKLLEFCENHRGFAILDLPKATVHDYQNILSDYRLKLDSNSLKYGASFFPNLETAFSYCYDDSEVEINKNGFFHPLSSFTDSLVSRYKSAIDDFSVNLPASSAVMGAIIKNDVDRGIWKNPASVALNQVIRPEIPLTDNEQQLFIFDPSEKPINCIRNFTGRGNLIWGGRTLAGNDNEWRYLSVRRLANKIEKEIQNSLSQFCMEENKSSTWSKIKLMTSDYLYGLWKSGAFMGVKPEFGYFVSCGLNETMTATDIAAGRLILQIGIAPLKPAEFIILNCSLSTPKA